MIHATKPELETIIRDAANGLIAQSKHIAALLGRVQFDAHYAEQIAVELDIARAQLAAAESRRIALAHLWVDER